MNRMSTFHDDAGRPRGAGERLHRLRPAPGTQFVLRTPVGLRVVQVARLYAVDERQAVGILAALFVYQGAVPNPDPLVTTLNEETAP